MENILSVLLLLCVSVAHSELLQVTILARHGNRAPNEGTDKLCPNFAPVIRMFDVPHESLTGRGMQQLVELGTAVRQSYITNMSFVPKIYDTDSVYFRASDSSRTLQSGSAFGMGLYPIGTGPPNYNSSLPPPLPIHTDDEGSDSVMEVCSGTWNGKPKGVEKSYLKREYKVRKAQCKKRRKKDEKVWKRTIGKKWLAEHKELIDTVSELCGADIMSQGDPFGAIKNINDAFTFAHKEGFPRLKGVDKELAMKFSTFAHLILYDKFFSTPYKNAYMAGDFPALLVNNFVKRARNITNGETNKPLNAYFGHREISYGISEMMRVPKLRYHEGSPVSELPPGSTFIWELHYEDDEYIVKFGTFVPCLFQGTSANKKHYKAKNCGFNWVHLPDCGLDKKCTLDEFSGIFSKFHDKYRWREICGTKARAGGHRVIHYPHGEEEDTSYLEPSDMTSANDFDFDDDAEWDSDPFEASTSDSTWFSSIPIVPFMIFGWSVVTAFYIGTVFGGNQARRALPLQTYNNEKSLAAASLKTSTQR